MRELIGEYGLWVLLVVILVAIYRFGSSLCAPSRRRAADDEGQVAVDPGGPNGLRPGRK